MNFFAWFGRKGFMRGPIWGFLLLVSWPVFLGSVQTVFNADTHATGTSIMALICSAAYLGAYYFLPGLLHRKY